MSGSVAWRVTYTLNQGWETELLSRAAWIVEYRWRAVKSSYIIFNFYFYLPKESEEKKTMSSSERDFSLLTVYMSACHGILFWRDVVFWRG